MLFFIYAILAALAAVSFASPVEVPRLGFTVHSAPIKGVKLKNQSALAVLTGPYAKYGAPVPPRLQAALAIQKKKTALKAGSVVTTPQTADVSYLVPVTLSGKTFQMVLDTGSSDFWVFSNLMPKVQSKGHLTYNVTSKNLMKGQTFGVHYGDGSSAGGPVYADKVAIGGVTVTAQAVEAATSASSLFVGETAADGLMGMAFIGLNTVRPTPQKSFFTNAMPSLASKLFAVTLRHQLPGSFDLGFINSTKYTGKLNYINVVNMNPSTSATFWQFNLRKYVVGKSSIDTGSNYPSIVDTATSLMYLPAPVVTAYYKSVKGAAVDPTWAAYTFPCNSSLPNIGVVINGVTYYVKAPLLNWERINGTHCLGGLQSSANLRFNVLGAVFLKSVYAVFDQTQATPRVGFAAQSGK